MRKRTPPRAVASPGLDAARRAAELEELAAGQDVDVVVIGGGFTGVGVALDAASRGLSVALLERRDLAHGTSRFSSKLAHGGLRYLAKGEVGIAWESARERGLLIKNIAPHLVHPLPMVFPLSANVSRFEGLAAGAGFRAGNVLRILARTPASLLPRPTRISAAETHLLTPAVKRAKLRGALLSWDGQLEDDARLVVAIARTAAAHGARILTYTTVTEVTPDGVMAVDERTGRPCTVRARHVVNAAGVWANHLAKSVELRPSKGSHLLVPAARLGNPRAALTAPVPGHFGRYVFAVPWPDGLVMIGLTDEPFDGEIPDEPLPDAAEESFLLDVLGRALEIPLTSADVVGRFAGFRPLLAGKEGSSADLSRRHAIVEDPDTGMLTIVGGKLTAYRRMAQDVVDRIAARPGVAAGRCVTKRLPLVGAGPVPEDTGIPPRLLRRFGAEAADVVALAEGRPELLEPISPEIPICRAELRFAVQRELALTPDDLLDRRTRAGLVPAWREPVLAAAREIVPDLFTPAAASKESHS